MQRKYQMRIGSQPFHRKCFLSHVPGLGARAQPHGVRSCRVLGMAARRCRPLEGTAPADHGRAFHLREGGLTSRLGGRQRWKHRSSTDKNMPTLKNTRLVGNKVRGSSYWKMRIQSLLPHSWFSQSPLDSTPTSLHHPISVHILRLYWLKWYRFMSLAHILQMSTHPSLKLPATQQVSNSFLKSIMWVML